MFYSPPLRIQHVGPLPQYVQGHSRIHSDRLPDLLQRDGIVPDPCERDEPIELHAELLRLTWANIQAEER